MTKEEKKDCIIAFKEVQRCLDNRSESAYYIHPENDFVWGFGICALLKDLCAESMITHLSMTQCYELLLNYKPKELSEGDIWFTHEQRKEVVNKIINEDLRTEAIQP